LDPFESTTVSCDTLSNIGRDELTSVVSYESGAGYFAGCNDHNITTYAEEFSTADSALITGIQMYVGSLNPEAEGGITISVNSERNGRPGEPVYQKYIPYTKLHLYFNYLEFYPFVKTTGKFFISYSPACSEGDLFALEQVQWRTSSDNTAWMKLSSGWVQMSDQHPEDRGTSLYIEPVLCFYEDEPASETDGVQVSLYPNPTSSLLVCSVVSDREEFKTGIYDTQGHLHDVDITWYDNEFMIDVSSLSRGVYIFRLYSSTRIYNRRFIKI
jgi:hypothetical protein